MFVMIFIHCQHQSNTCTKMAIAFQGVFQFCHTFSAQFFRFCQNRVKTWVSKIQLPLLLLTWLLTLHSSYWVWVSREIRFDLSFSSWVDSWVGNVSPNCGQSEAKILGTWLFSGCFGAMWLQNALVNAANPLNQCCLHCSQCPSTRGLLRTQLAW